MTNKKNDTYGFSLVVAGLLIGFFLGAGIVYLISSRPDDHLLTNAALERISRLFQPEESQLPAAGAKTGSAPVPPREMVADLTPPPGSGIPTDSLDQTGMNIPDSGAGLPDEEEPASGSLSAHATTDSIGMQTTGFEGPSHYTREVVDDEIRLKRDRLISTIGFALTHSDLNPAHSETTKRLDSLLGNTHEYSPRIITIEFWESPLHFTGYKMGKNKVVIYGLDQIESVSLLTLDEDIFLKYYEFFFPLEPTSEFLPLVPLSDAILIHKLEQQWP
ncbi:MAG: hypothetical protein R6U86_04910 [Bacteroidales bacterium]